VHPFIIPIKKKTKKDGEIIVAKDLMKCGRE
jgi:hypothetical protein